MNERIQELWAKAVDIAVPETYTSLSWGQIEKIKTVFAQLIVQECANHCDLLLDHKISSEWSRGTHDCSRAIKKHFGVEL
jgi:hypothetical protein